MTECEAQWKTMRLLFADAKERKMFDLCETYGWSAIRLGELALAANPSILGEHGQKEEGK